MQRIRDQLCEYFYMVLKQNRLVLKWNCSTWAAKKLLDG